LRLSRESGEEYSEWTLQNGIFTCGITRRGDVSADQYWTLCNGLSQIPLSIRPICSAVRSVRISTRSIRLSARPVLQYADRVQKNGENAWAVTHGRRNFIENKRKPKEIDQN
jgi:hypothetical protein